MKKKSNTSYSKEAHYGRWLCADILAILDPLVCIPSNKYTYIHGCVLYYRGGKKVTIRRIVASDNQAGGNNQSHHPRCIHQTKRSQ